MSWVSNVQVLRGFKPLARTLTIFNPENFNRNQHRHAIWRNILRAIGCITLLISLATVASLNCWTCFLPERGWSDRASHLALMLGQLQGVFVFAAMTRKNRRITGALQQLQQTIDIRENSSHSHIYLF